LRPDSGWTEISGEVKRNFHIRIKNEKGTIFLSVITLIFGFIIVGCSSDDSRNTPSGVPEDDIIGTWSLTSITTDTVETPENLIPSYRLEFTTEVAGNRYYQGFDTPFQWSVSDERITISIWENAGIVSDNIINYTFTEDVHKIVQVYTKQ